ncbi:protein AAR2 homolog isoform X1 [Gallus gallus]|uniref:protein AAR2 homolog isoform X1 n=1 Tax=Gallus gallus TaxID=9031 RepID=UPI001AE131CD|nr:protein AAR2 homolog isoform X1 [Gallus gallus]XP_046786574.1 protein AAR2 homolog isoform X1 [Gallus gallus]
MAGPQADPELAKRLFFEGAAVVVLGVPEGTEFGIDYNSWTVGPRFRGVKMVPPGVHFVHCSAARTAGGTETGPRAGLFLCLRPRQVRALRWEPGSEELREAAPGEEEALGRDLREMDAFLGPYPYETLKKWISLSSFVGEAAVERLQPESGQISAFSEVLPVRAGRHGRDRAGQKLPPYDAGCGSYAEGVARLPEMRPRAGTEIRFTELPRQTYPDGASPEEITRHSMDLSYALEKVIARRYAGRPQDLLAELQFAFICFLIGNVYDAFEHWKRLLNILCRSEDAIAKYQDLYANLIFVLYHQLNEIPSDFFVDIVSQDNFLTSTLQAQPPQSQRPKEEERQNCLHLTEPRSHSHTSWALLCLPCPTAAVQIKGEHTWGRDVLTAVQQRGVWFRVSWLLYYAALPDYVIS